MAYGDYIENIRKEFLGKMVMFEGKEYTIAAVDYNGIIHIDKPTQYTETTAVYDVYEARKNVAGDISFKDGYVHFASFGRRYAIEAQYIVSITREEN